MVMTLQVWGRKDSGAGYRHSGASPGKNPLSNRTLNQVPSEFPKVGARQRLQQSEYVLTPFLLFNAEGTRST